MGYTLRSSTFFNLFDIEYTSFLCSLVIFSHEPNFQVTFVLDQATMQPCRRGVVGSMLAY